MNSGHSRFIDVNGTSLHYLEWGEEANPPLILLHGGSAHAHWWDHIAPSLARTFRVLAFDLRGHGDSSWITPPAYEIQDYVADLEAVIATLQLDSPSLLGHSLGGFIALSYATAHAPTLGALIIVDIGPQLRQSRYMRLLRTLPPPIYQDEMDLHNRFRLLPADTQATADLLRHIAHHSVQPGEDGNLHLKGDRAAMIRQPCDLTPLLPTIVCPTFFLRGQNSKNLSQEKLGQIVQVCPQAHGVEIPGAGHHIFLDQPFVFLDIVTNFLHEKEIVTTADAQRGQGAGQKKRYKN
jgi:pimeloyl-ACP methyl ester carboxylesterase